MERNKYDFFDDLLNNKKLNPQHKEKIFSLIKSDLKNDISFSKNLEIRIKKLEHQFNIDSESDQKIIEKELKDYVKLNIDFIDPFSEGGINDFFKAYNQDPILKYTWHPVDQFDALNAIKQSCGMLEYNFITHRNIIKAKLETLLKQYSVNDKVINIFYNFLNDHQTYELSREWSEDAIEINWNSVELIEWVNQNPGIPPHINESLSRELKNKGMKIKRRPKLKYFNTRIDYFFQLIIHFKNLFRIRVDNPLVNEEETGLLQKIVDKDFNKNDISITFHSSLHTALDFFVDVEKFITCFKAILRTFISICKEKKFDKPAIELRIENPNEESFELIFHHQNVAQYGKGYYQTRQNIGEKHQLLIEQHINGLAHFYLRANFENNQSYEINLWNNNTRFYRKINDVKGVQYILRFKK